MNTKRLWAILYVYNLIATVYATEKEIEEFLEKYDDLFYHGVRIEEIELCDISELSEDDIEEKLNRF